MNEASVSGSLLDKDVFLSRLSALFEATKEKNAVWITHKRLTFEGGDTNTVGPVNEAASKEYACIIKATNGKGVKISTQIKPDELESFHAAYGTILKSSMTNLKRRDKKKEKARHERALLRRKKLEQDVIPTGSKRGKGHRQYQRRVQAAIKQAQVRRMVAERAKEHTKQKTL